MKNHYILILLLFLLLFGCNRRKEVPFPLHETEWEKPTVVPIGKTDTIPLPDSLPNAQYTWKGGKLVERDQSRPLAKPNRIPLGKPKTVPTGLAPIPIPKNLPNAEYTTIDGKLVKRDRGIPLLPPKVVALGKTDTIPAKGKVVIAKPPKSVPLGPLGMRDNDAYGIRILGQDQGLPGAGATCIVHDRVGRLWVGTDNGLACLEGGKVKIYNVENGLSDNYVLSLLEDRKGRIWIGTNGGGLNLLNLGEAKDNLRFVHYTTKNGLSHNSVRSLLEDSKGRVWIGTDGGGMSLLDLSKAKPDLSEVEGRFVHYNIENGLSSNYVYSILEDSKGRIWIGTDGGGISRLDLSAGGEFVHCTTENGLSHNSVLSLMEDSKGRLWIGTAGGGLNLLDLSKAKPDLSEVEGRFVHYNIENGLSSNYVYSILEDSKGRIWIGTDGGGISRLDLSAGGEFVHYTTENGLSHNSVWSLLKGRKGRLWIGTYRGLSLLDLSGGVGFLHYTTKNGLSHSYVRSLLEDSTGRLLIGTNSGGLNLLDLSIGGKFVHYTTENGLSDNDVLSLLEDSRGRLWVGTNGGLNLLDPSKAAGGGFFHYTTQHGLSHNFVWSLLEGSRGRIWIGTYGGGVNLLNLNEAEGGFLHYTTENGLSSNYVLSLLEDSRGRLWVGTNGGGLNLLDLSEAKGDGFLHYSTENGLSDNHVLALLEDSKGRIWIGTYGGGLNLLDGDKGFLHFKITDGLVDNAVLQLSEDSLGHIWAGTGKGLTRLMEKKNGSFQLKTWDKAHGFKDIDFNGPGNPMLFDRKGRMWTGVGQTLTAFNPPPFDSIPPKLFLTQIDVDGKTADWRKLSSYKGLADTLWLAGQDSFLLSANFPPDTSWLTRAGLSWAENDTLAPYFLPIGLEVPYSHNRLTFHYSGLKLDEQFDVVYRYMLEGQDKGWSPFTKEAKADYRNLSPGSYTFKVRARSRDYVWSEEKAFSFDVLPPWYQTWWAYTIYFLAVFGAAYAFYRYKINQIKAKNAELEKLVQERTEELQTSNEELQSSNEEIQQQAEEISTQRDSLQASYQNLQLLSAVGREITHHIKVEEIIDTVYAEVNRLMPAEGFGIGIFNEQENRIDFPGYIEKGQKLPFHYDELSDDDSLSDLCFKQQREILINDYDAEVSSHLHGPKTMVGGKPVSLMYVPLLVKDKPVGNITVQSFRKNAYQPYHLNLLRNIATYVSVALDNASAYEKLDEEREKSESLLLNILPHETAQELKEKGYASTKHFERVSVLFTDFKGFTSIAEKMSPEEVVENLDYCFRAFDDIVKKHGLEKIKTIGDAYMAAGGIPLPDEDNAQRAVNAALEMVAFMNAWKAEKEAQGENVWEVRIGIHTGPVVAGVVGKDKFAYDIWGDTVNTASRMESSGVPGKVNISDATYQILVSSVGRPTTATAYQFEYRGEVEAKGKGKVGMWFVE